MRKIILLTLLSIFISAIKANPGDTTKVRSHDKVHLNWYGDFDRMAKFPDATKTYNRIWMHYTMGCPTKGCSEWDYTTQVHARKRTGKYDSTLKQTPNFRVNGNAKDSVWYSNTVTYKYNYNANTQGIDSVANDTLKIDVYGDSTKPLTKTSTLTVWVGNYYKPVYDSTGTQTDSIYIGFDNLLVGKSYNYYSVFEIIENYELGRVITPYNGNVPNTWQYTYTFDVTDYVTLLQDSVEIRASFSGYQDGFTITLDFEFIEGTPARQCYKVIPLWNGSHSYGDDNNTIENFLVPRDVAIDGQMKQASIRIIQTGHGFGGADGCSEFCAKTHYLKIGGQARYQKSIWRDNCGLNPIYPQGGTWVYDRANWCPGAEVWPYDYDVTQYLTANSTNTIDLDMEPYTNQGNSNTSYIVSGALFLYKDNSYTTDASIEEIMAPNNTLRYARFNPVCDYPQVKVRNNGGDTIRSIEFLYGPKGGTRVNYTWNGILAPYQTAEIKMGTYINFTVGTPTTGFETEIIKVNGNADQVTYNNAKGSSFANTPVYPQQIIVWFKTNNRASENSYTIKNQYGTTVYSKSGLANATTYQDTITLVNDCYSFVITDDGGDGIGFWANPNAGTGSLFFRRANNGQVLKNFGSDWGRSVVHNFTVGFALGADQPDDKAFVEVYPNPSTGEFWLNMNLPQSDKATVFLYDYNGRMIQSEDVPAARFAAHNINMQNLADGLYIVKVVSGQSTYTQKLIKTAR